MMTAIVTIQAVILIVLCVLVTGLLRAYGTVLRRLHQLDGGEVLDRAEPTFRTAEGVSAPRSVPDAGDSDSASWPPAHDISGQDQNGEIVAVRVVDVPQDTVLLFLSSGCTGCQRFWDEVRTYRPARGARLLIITKSPTEESPARVRELCPPGVDLIMSSAAWSDYRVPGSPYVIVTNGRTGRVRGEGSGSSLEQLGDLMRVAGEDARGPGGGLRKPKADRERESDVDQVLLAAGIVPGHPSLYADAEGDSMVEPAPRRLLDLYPAESGHAGRNGRQ